jgi:cell division protein FtsZ
MKDSGVAIMGSYAAEGDNRALKAVEGALNSPLLEDNEIEGARYILLNISSGDKEVTMDEVTVITDYIQQEAGLSADLIWGNCTDETLGDKLAVTIIATGFQTMEERQQSRSQAINFAPDFAVEDAPLVKPVEHVNCTTRRSARACNVPSNAGACCRRSCTLYGLRISTKSRRS